MEEKFKKQDEFEDSDSGSSSEDEDDVGVLATEALDNEIFATLAAIKNKDSRIYDGKTPFYAPIEETMPAEDDDDDDNNVKPMFLRDFNHCDNLGHQHMQLAGVSPYSTTLDFI